MTTYEDKVCAKIQERRKLGLAKYGVGVERSDLMTSDWLNHAQQEAMDLAIYLERLIQLTTQTLPILLACLLLSGCERKADRSELAESVLRAKPAVEYTQLEWFQGYLRDFHIYRCTNSEAYEVWAFDERRGVFSNMSSAQAWITNRATECADQVFAELHKPTQTPCGERVQ